MSAVISHPRFVVGRTLGSGGFGIVYQAFDRERNATVALKLLHRSEAKTRDRFKTEFRELSLLQHPNLPALYELFHHEQAWFFSMELVPGPNFVRYVRSGTDVVEPRSVTPTTSLEATAAPTSSADVMTAFRPPDLAVLVPDARVDRRKLRNALDQLLTALAFLHSSGKVHRDVKPSNVVVGPDGRLFVLDFGLVAARGDTQERFEGTPAYASPEQCLGEQTGPASDYYSAGVLLFESLFGRRPFDGERSQLMLDKTQFDAPRADPTSAGDLEDVVALCNGLLARDSATRWAALAMYSARAGSAVSAVSEDDGRSARVAFVGRHEELTKLEKSYDAANGHQQVVLLEGASALGKSTLIRAFLERVLARAPETPVFAGRASDRERVAFNAFDGMAARLAATFSKTGAPAHDLFEASRIFQDLDGATEVEEGGSTEPSRDEAFDAVRRLFGSLAPQRPILWLDDVQWADADSVALLAALFREPSAPSMFVILSRRPTSQSFPIPYSTEHIVLDALSPADIAELVDRLVAPSVDRGRRRQICLASAGVPLFAEELARTAEDEAIPDSLVNAIRKRFDQLPPSAREILRLICFSNVPLRDAQLAEATHLPSEIVQRTLEELRVLHLVRIEQSGSGRRHLPFHDRIRETLEDAALPTESCFVHATIARVLDEHDLRDAAPLVAHLRRAGEDESAARFVLPAAERAETLLAYEQAARLYREALLLKRFVTVSETLLRERLAHALERALLSHDAAAEWAALAETATDPARRSHYLEKASRLYLWSGELDHGLVTLTELLGLFGERMPKSQTAALLDMLAEQALDLGVVRALRRSRPPTADGAAVAHYTLLRGAGEGLGMIDNVRGALFHARAFRVSRALADRMLRAEALGLEAIFRGCAGALGRRRARSLLLELEALFPEGLPDRARAWREVALAVTSMQGAPTIEAAARIKAAEKLFVDLQEGDAWAVSSCRVIRALTLRIVGDLQGLRVVIPELIADADRRNDRYVYATIARGGFTLWKADDTPERGRALLRSPELAWPRVDGSFHLQEWVGLEAACELSLYEGRGMQAWEEHRRDLGRLGRAPFNLLIQSVRILVGYLIGRLEVVRAEATRSTTAALNARRYAIQLGLEGTSYASARSELLFAGLASTSARTDKMLRHLQRAERHAELGQLPLVGAISKFLIGRAEGGDGGRDRAREAEATLRALSIKDPARFVVSEVAAMERLV